MLTNKHLLIHPSGEMEWVELHRERRYDDIYCGSYAYDLDEIAFCFTLKEKSNG